MPTERERISYTPQQEHEILGKLEMHIQKDRQEILSAEETKRLAKELNIDPNALEGLASFEYLLNWIKDEGEKKDQFLLSFVKDGRVFESIGDLDKLGLTRDAFASHIGQLGYRIENEHPFWLAALHEGVLKRREIPDFRGLENIH